jgi:hypothetical protein
MRKPTTLRRNRKGVSEIIGTMLILSMTVVLFSVIILWVNSFPPPRQAVRLDLEGSLRFELDTQLNDEYGNITLVHKGGDVLPDDDTRIYLRVTPTSGSPSTITLRTQGTYQSRPYGLTDSVDAKWGTGEHWNFRGYSINPTDSVQVIIGDVEKNLLLWDSILTTNVGERPPIFLEKWGDRTPNTLSIDTPVVGEDFRILARITDLDGDLNASNVYVVMAFLNNNPIAMKDDGTSGDYVAGDGVFTSALSWEALDLNWDQGAVRLNATDDAGHETVAWFALEVLIGFDQQTGGNQSQNNALPRNFICSGDSCYNIFAAGTDVGEWDADWTNAIPRRTFTESETVVVAILTSRIKDPNKPEVLNNFFMYDPFGTTVSTQRVVYGTNKQVTPTSTPSSTEAFAWSNETNGYFLYEMRFKLNVPPGTNPVLNYVQTPSHPPQYFFTQYAVFLEVKGALPQQDPPESKYFRATDQIKITSDTGYVVNYPDIATYSSAAFTTYEDTFNSTDKIWVGLNVSSADSAPGTVSIGNVLISDFIGQQQVNRAPINGREANIPLCRSDGVCSSGTVIIGISSNPAQYRFMIDLAQANQDPWVEGLQPYALSVLSIRDSNEQYSAPITFVVNIRAPHFKLDIVTGTNDIANSAWGTHDVAYYYENINALDRWRKDRLEFGPDPPASPYVRAVKFGNLDSDNDLDIAMSKFVSNGEKNLYWYRRDVDSNQNTIWTRFTIELLGGVLVNDIEITDFNRDNLNEIVVGADNGGVWYYKNDGAWTRYNVDLSRTAAVNAITVGDFDGDEDKDIAVARAGGTVTYYLNSDGFGSFVTQAQTDQWYAEYEQTTTGTRSGSYTDTFSSDDVREQLTEVTITQGSQSGSTTNPTFDTDANGWTAADWETPAQASQTWQSSGGNPNGYVRLTSTATNSAVWVSGYWWQAFTVSGSAPFTANVNFDWGLLQWGTKASQGIFYIFVDTGSGTPTLGQQSWNSGTLTGANGWQSGASADVQGGPGGVRITAPGTYYLKVAFRVLMQSGNCGSNCDTFGGFDGVTLSWSSSSGDTSALTHYWRFQQLPSRPNSNYFFNIEGFRSGAGSDNFHLFYSTTGQFGTYLHLAWMNNSGDANQNIQLPSTLGGATVWVRAEDTDRTVGNTQSDTLHVDRMYLEVQTSAGSSGADITGLGSDVLSIDAGDQDGDARDDVVAGTQGGNIYYLAGTGGGLSNQGVRASPGSAVVGLKLGEITTAQTGLEIVAAFGTSVRIMVGGTGGTIHTLATPAGHTATGLAVGDVDADGDGLTDDDIVVITGSGTQYGEIGYYRNLGGSGANWDAVRVVDDLGVKVYDVDLGDADKSDKLGR